MSEHGVETLSVTGTGDADYDLIALAHRTLEEAARLENHIEDAQLNHDSELADFFARTQQDRRREAEEAKSLLAARVPTGGRAVGIASASTGATAADDLSPTPVPRAGARVADPLEHSPGGLQVGHSPGRPTGPGAAVRDTTGQILPGTGDPETADDRR
jgi:hypothetical protein